MSLNSIRTAGKWFSWLWHFSFKPNAGINLPWLGVRQLLGIWLGLQSSGVVETLPIIVCHCLNNTWLPNSVYFPCSLLNRNSSMHWYRIRFCYQIIVLPFLAGENYSSIALMYSKSYCFVAIYCPNFETFEVTVFWLYGIYANICWIVFCRHQSSWVNCSCWLFWNSILSSFMRPGVLCFST